MNNVIISNEVLFCAITFAPSQASNLEFKLSLFMLLDGLPILLGIIITLTGYLLAIKKMRELATVFSLNLDPGFYKLLWYPLVLFLILTPVAVYNFISICINQQQSSDIMRIVHLIVYRSIGLTNAVVYGLQRESYDDSSKSGLEISRLELSSPLFDERSSLSSQDSMYKAIY